MLLTGTAAPHPQAKLPRHSLIQYFLSPCIIPGTVLVPGNSSESGQTVKHSWPPERCHQVSRPAMPPRLQGQPCEGAEPGREIQTAGRGKAIRGPEKSTKPNRESGKCGLNPDSAADLLCDLGPASPALWASGPYLSRGDWVWSL